MNDAPPEASPEPSPEPSPFSREAPPERSAPPETKQDKETGRQGDKEPRLAGAAQPPVLSAPPEVPEIAPPAKASTRELSDAERAALPNQLEALLLTADRALTGEKLAEVLDVPAKLVREAADELNAIYESTQRSFRIEQVAGGWQMLTLPAYAELLAALHRTRTQAKLSPAALETLAIIAYKQPVLRAQVEAIRGVASGEMIRGLMDRHLVRIAGRAEEIGRPILYGTTRTFLEVFGLGSLKDLPETDKAK